VISRRNSR